MTPKQAAFVREFLTDLCATRAAIRAGYSARTAAFIGAENLKKPQIASAIERAMSERSERTEITADRVLEKIGHLAFFDIRNLLNPDGTLRPLDALDEATAAVISGLEATELRNADGEPIGVVKKLKLTDRLGALTLLARHLGMLNDKLTLKGDAENPLTLLVKAIQGNTIRPVANPPTISAVPMPAISYPTASA